MKRRVQIDSKLSKLYVRAKFVLVLIALATLWASALAQENTAEDWYKKGTELFENRSWEESTRAMKEVIQIDPDNSSAWLSIAETFGILGNGSEASKAYEKALSIVDEDLLEKPEDAKAWQAKSEALIGLGRQEEAFSAQEKALEILNQSIKNNPKDGEAWWSKARILGSMGRDDEALQAYEKIIELNHTPRLADALLAKSFVLAVKDEYDGFLEAFNRGIELIPDSDNVKLAQAWNDAGFAFYELDRERWLWRHSIGLLNWIQRINWHGG